MAFLSEEAASISVCISLKGIILTMLQGRYTWAYAQCCCSAIWQHLFLMLLYAEMCSKHDMSCISEALDETKITFSWMAKHKLCMASCSCLKCIVSSTSISLACELLLASSEMASCSWCRLPCHHSRSRQSEIWYCYHNKVTHASHLDSAHQVPFSCICIPAMPLVQKCCLLLLGHSLEFCQIRHGLASSACPTSFLSKHALKSLNRFGAGE